MNYHPLSNSTFTFLNEHHSVAYENATSKNTQIAAEELCEINLVTNISKASIHFHMFLLIGIDKNRDTLNGVVTAIDKHSLTKYCRKCRIWEDKKDLKELDEWKVINELECKLILNYCLFRFR